MTIETTQSGDKLTMHLAGRLDTLTAPQLQEALPGAFAGSRQVEVDCAALEYVSSAGLRVLLLANRQAAEADAALTFVNVSDDVMEVLRMTGFSDLLQIN